MSPHQTPQDMVHPAGFGRCQVSVVVPDYLYHYPCFKKVQLAAVKKQTFHPNLPTFRAMLRDSVLCKLPDDHCQSTTCCTAEDFAEAAFNAHMLPVTRRHCYDITETGRRPDRMLNTPEDIRKSSAIWSHYVNNQKLFADRPEDRLLDRENYVLHNLHFDGARIKRMLPDKRDRRMRLTAEPRLDTHGYGQQQPTPSDLKSRYRHPHPLFFRNMSAQLWRDTDSRAQHPNPPAVTVV